MVDIPMLDYFDCEHVVATWNQASDGSYVNGQWTPGPFTASSINIISPQPVNASDMVMLEDGEHVSDFVKIWTSEVSVFTRELNKDADQIVVNGKTYKVTQVDDRKLGIYIKVIMKKLG